MVTANSQPQVQVAPAPLPPGPPPLELLTPFERFNVRLMDLLERHAVPATERYLRTWGNFWMYFVTSRMLTGYGYERLAGVPTDAPILLVSNHRSYFDLYVLAVLLNRFTRLHQPMFCPVRADFFYEHVAGTFLNLAVGAGRMYPPVFREPSKAEFNKWSLAHLGELLRRGNVVVGFHPEGRRNKNANPYERLPAQPGVGKLVMDSWPVVIPVFINGFTNDFLGDVKANFQRKKRVLAVFGAPIDLTPFRGMSNRLASHKRIADRLLSVVYDELGAEERRIRSSLPHLPLDFEMPDA
ncbi:MAG TPA: lysophospholipid acyltransferase family protein [Polyangia bacterium]|jgi:1-acyl-sn-glycerol-3-phosphate acyltransferase|nr:lysophospholipid acyltransferase family protein [Polyangia bacterium]